MISDFPAKGSIVRLTYESRSRYGEHTIKSRTGILIFRSAGVVSIENPRSGFIYRVRRESILSLEEMP